MDDKVDWSHSFITETRINLNLHTTVKDIFDEKKLTVHSSPRDGNCLYWCLAHQILGRLCGRNCVTLKHVLLNIELCNLCKLNEKLLNSVTSDDVLIKFRDGQWGGLDELVVFANTFGITIFVYMLLDNEIMQLKIDQFEDNQRMFVPDNIVETVFFSYFQAMCISKTVHLYLTGAHFSSLIP